MWRYPILNQVILLSFQIVLYFGCEYFQHNVHDVHRAADDHIPFLPWTSAFYCLWFPLIALFPLAVYGVDPRLYRVYMASMVLEIIVSVACYLIYPTSFERPVPPDTFWGRSMKLVYRGSYRGLNCAPSLHCSSCYLILYTAALCGGMPLPLRALSAVVALLIVLSTMTTKQHTVMDVLTALPCFALCTAAGTFAAQSLIR